jgi:DNA topoisomerase-3
LQELSPAYIVMKMEDRTLKKLVLAEKPSVGRQLATALGCHQRFDGYMEGERWIVTWALGHLVELANPDHYSERYRRWSVKDLPMLPPTLEQVVIEQTQSQFVIVKALMERQDIEALVIATDAGREGELVARWIMKLANWNKPSQRLWISSQTEKAIAEGFANLRDASLYDTLFEAAQCRAAADWYVGMNVTRAMTCVYDARLSAGRVQTPTLALMVDREDEIERFTGSIYWTLRANFTHFIASYYPKEDTIRITDEAIARTLEVDLIGKRGRVIAIEETDRSESPPLAYDLTELQRDANTLLDFSAKETLDILQVLYERHKLVTYPRTDSRYITTDIVPTLTSRLSALRTTAFADMAAKYIAEGLRSDDGRFVQDAKVGDHHAIIPTEERINLDRLSTQERALWELIVVRFLEVLSPDYHYRTTNITIDVDDHLFKNRVTIPVSPGWRSVAAAVGKKSAASLEEEDVSVSSILLTLQEGDEVRISSTQLRRMTTPPPPRYSEATLLSAMEHAGRLVDDTALKRSLGGGIGTPATRADIIEKLIQNHYIEREGKELVPTPKGRELIRLVPEQLRSVELTGRWEKRLSQIADGSEKSIHFIEDIKANARELVEQVIASTEVFSPIFADSRRCPHCEGPMMKVVDALGHDHYICQRLSCAYEERLVRRRVQEESPAPKRRVVVKRKNEGEEEPTKRVVVRKRAQPQERWITVTEVVRPSKRQRFERPVREDRGGWQSGHRSTHLVDESPASGGSIADFIRASEERKRRDRKKKR